jgi:hypothetical protein
VAGAEGVVFALGAAGETAEPVLLAQGADAVAAAGEDLVRVGLVADIPDQAVLGGVKHGVERDGELDDAEAGAEMPTGDRNGVDDFGTQLIGELAQLGAVEGLEVGRRMDGIEQRGRWPIGQWGAFAGFFHVGNGLGAEGGQCNLKGRAGDWEI